MIQPFVRNKTEKCKSVALFRSKTSVGRPAPCAAKKWTCTQRLYIIICDTLKVRVTRSCIRAAWLLLPESSFIWFVFRQSMVYSSALSPEKPEGSDTEDLLKTDHLRQNHHWTQRWSTSTPESQQNDSFSSSSIHWPVSSICWRLFHWRNCKKKNRLSFRLISFCLFFSRLNIFTGTNFWRCDLKTTTPHTHKKQQLSFRLISFCLISSRLENFTVNYSWWLCLNVRACVCVRACECVRACVRASVRACERACVCVCVCLLHALNLENIHI